METLIWCLYVALGWVFGRWVWLRLTRRKPPLGTTVLITGGCSGIGKAIALRFAAEHYSIVIWDIADHLFPCLVSEVEKAGGRCTCLKCDVCDEAEVISTSERTLSLVGQVDIVVCNAGIAQKRFFLDLSSAQFRSTIETNLFGCVHVIRAFLASRQTPRQIVVLSSILAFGTVSRLSEYSASKHALHAFLTTVRVEAKERGLKVEFTEVCPWQVDTQMFQGWRVRWGLFPPISPKDVADCLFEAVCTRQALVVTPWYHWYLFSFLNQLPPCLHDRAVLFLVPPESKKQA